MNFIPKNYFHVQFDEDATGSKENKDTQKRKNKNKKRTIMNELFFSRKSCVVHFKIQFEANDSRWEMRLSIVGIPLLLIKMIVIAESNIPSNIIGARNENVAKGDQMANCLWTSVAGASRAYTHTNGPLACTPDRKPICTGFCSPSQRWRNEISPKVDTISTANIDFNHCHLLLNTNWWISIVCRFRFDIFPSVSNFFADLEAILKMVVQVFLFRCSLLQNVPCAKWSCAEDNEK